ncbi:hypothetical protein [Streptomyces sp. DSM 40750]|uniref:hypothetical protein n=1 Tax=Streptomyces sp. DSM 40750 TaxID=2801030 RepID=UPI00214C42C3|nr:hypothetical protein [Streptomyces sp. DSM 40750]UUU23782.1 hypothetical protein JIX55_27960 [Streptomyces sp. DSM 40750]
MNHAPESLRFHIEYRGYVTAHQVATMMATVDESYEALFYFYAPNLREKPLNESKRLRVRRLETGSSLMLEFIEGAKQMSTSIDPNLRGIAGGAATVALTGKLLLHVATRGIKVFQDTKMRQREIEERELSNAEKTQTLISKKDEEDRKREAEVELKRAQAKINELALEALEQFTQEEGDKPTRDPQHTVDLLCGPLSQLMQVLNGDNIGNVTLNNKSLTSEEQTS